jgi:hypothetical protein
VPEEADLVLSETTTLDTPLVLLDSLLFVVSPMLERIMRRAVERAYLRYVPGGQGTQRIKRRNIAPRYTTSRLLAAFGSERRWRLGRELR